MSYFRSAAAAALVLIATGAAAEDSAGISGSPKSLGDPDAPVSVIEYASLSCPACAMFHNERFPWLAETFIETGRVRFEFRDFPLNAPGLWAAMLAHCAGPKRYFAYLDLLFRRQARWAFAEQPHVELKRVARQAGMSGSDFDSCMANESLQEEVIRSRATAVDEHDIGATPSFVINGEVLSGIPSEDELTRYIEAGGG